MLGAQVAIKSVSARPPGDVQVVCDWRALEDKLRNSLCLIGDGLIQRYQMESLRQNPSIEPIKLLVGAMFTYTPAIAEAHLSAEFVESLHPFPEGARLLATPPGSGRLEVQVRLHPNFAAQLTFLVAPRDGLMRSRDEIEAGVKSVMRQLLRLEPAVHTTEDPTARRLRMRREVIARYLETAQRALGKRTKLTTEQLVLLVVKAGIDVAPRFSVIGQAAVRHLLVDTRPDVIPNEQEAAVQLQLAARHDLLVLTMRHKIALTQKGTERLARELDLA